VQLGFEESLASRAVKQDLVPIGLPNGDEFGRPGAMEAKVNPARFATSHQNPFCHLECARFELVMAANGCVDEFSKIADIFNLVKTGQHY
jgi:hypothetical protein